MQAYVMDQLVTRENFNEHQYLASNSDVLRAVQEGQFVSGRQHFELFGEKESRTYRLSDKITEAKKSKLERIKPLLCEDMPYTETDSYFDFLSEEFKKTYNIHDTDVFARGHGYDQNAMALIEEFKSGMLLDYGAGKRPIYFRNVVNFEIAAYDTTDVLGVGEVLPFKDNTYDAVISIAVLEHVKDPFKCANEIARVIKPGGKLYCAVPVLQPFHPHPNHYYNMSHQGLRNLFDNSLVIDKVEVIESLFPIWTLAWFLRSWVDGLKAPTQKKFLEMKVSDLIQDTSILLHEDFVTELSKEKNHELASGNVIFAHKAG